MIEISCGSSGHQIASALPRDTTHAHAVVNHAVARFWPKLDHREMHDVFIVISEGGDGEHIARTVCATDHYDARQTHRDNYPGEPILEVHQ